MHLPLRSELLLTLSSEWAKHAVLKNIDDVTLHYLGGHVHVEACLPLQHLAQLEDVKALQQDFDLACHQISCVGECRLNFC